MSTSVETSVRVRVLMVVGSVLATLLVVEFALFPLWLAHVPLRLHVFLDEGIRPLAQSSKRGLLPHDYVGLVGDSYAQGRGDWLLSQDPNANGPFHSAHVIHDRSGRDVLSFGRGGTGSIRGPVEAVAKYRYLAASLRFPLEPPKDLLYYFYEGNDLHDTLVELLAVYAPKGAGQGFAALLHRAAKNAPDYFRGVLDHPRFGDAAFLHERLDALAASHPLARRLARPRWLDELYFGRFALALLGSWLGSAPPASPDEDVFPLQRQRPTALQADNFVRVRGQEVKLAVDLQGPAPELSPAETDAALWAFQESLRWLAGRFPDSRLCVVYIPSPAACYEIARGDIGLQPLGDRPNRFPAEVVDARSRELRARVGAIAAAQGHRFVDVTPAVRRNTRRELLHGPTDVRHFNRLGYTVLGNQAARCLDASPASP